MANVKKCDRCGKYYDKNIQHTVKSFGSVIAGIAFVTDRDFTDKRFDLCDDCMTKLKIWLFNGIDEED